MRAWAECLVVHGGSETGEAPRRTIRRRTDVERAAEDERDADAKTGRADAIIATGCSDSVIADLQCVGKNLQNRPVAYFATHLKKASRQPSSLRPLMLSGIRFTSKYDSESGDMQMLVLNKSSWHGGGASVVPLDVIIGKPRS